MAKKDQTWTQEEIDKIPDVAKKYKTRAEFSKNDPRTVRKARSLGIWDDITKHMKHGKAEIPESEIRKAAAKCESSGDFNQKHPNMYQKAARLKILQELFPDTYVPNPPKSPRKRWTEDMIREEAKKYSTRSDFKRGSEYAYARSGALGIRDEVCAHMP